MDSNRCKRFCLNCKQDWDKCKGIDCQCLDGACGCDFNPRDVRPFWYECIEQE